LLCHDRKIETLTTTELLPWHSKKEFEVARIRTIKPEFPQSESMGRVSRDARLLFIMLFTVADDSGITRGNSRMLASLLFPYDDDAPTSIEAWLTELEEEACVIRYVTGGQSYLQICNWLNHQKIDKPTPSKFPSFANLREDSRILPVGEEGKGIGEEGNRKGGESKKDLSAPSAQTPKKTGTRLPEDWLLPRTWGEWALSENPSLQSDDVRRIADAFKDHWLANANHAKSRKSDWQAAWRNWVRNQRFSKAAPVKNSVMQQGLDNAARAKKMLFGDQNDSVGV